MLSFLIWMKCCFCFDPNIILGILFIITILSSMTFSSCPSLFFKKRFASLFYILCAILSFLAFLSIIGLLLYTYGFSLGFSYYGNFGTDDDCFLTERNWVRSLLLSFRKLLSSWGIDDSGCLDRLSDFCEEVCQSW